MRNVVPRAARSNMARMMPAAPDTGTVADMRRVLVVVVLLLLAPAAHAAPGDLTQLPDPFGCNTFGGGFGCSDTTALDQPDDIAVSADGASVYAAVNLSESVVHWQRDPVTGGLTQPNDPTGCWSETGAGPCGDGKGLYFASGVAVSPDGRNVYVSAQNTVAVLDRDAATGLLTQRTNGTQGCYSQDGSAFGDGETAEPGVCATVPSLQYGEDIVVSPDNTAVFIAGEDSINAFTRDPATGDLTFVGCHNVGGTDGCATGRHVAGTEGISISPDGKTVYVTSVDEGTLDVFDRNTDTNTLTQKAGGAGCFTYDTDLADCAIARGMDTSFASAVSPDGEQLYLATRGLSIVVFDRAADGTLTQKAGTDGCLSSSPTTQTDETCAAGHDMTYFTGIVVSPDGADVYASAQEQGGLTLFSRDTASGVLSQAPRPGGCIASLAFYITNNYCQAAKAMGAAWGVAITPGGSNVYVVAHDDAVGAFARAGGADPTPTPSPSPSPVPPGQTATPATPTPSPSPGPTRQPKTYPPPRIRTVHVNVRNGSVTIDGEAPGPGTVTANADGSTTVRLRSATIAKKKKRKKKLRIASAKRIVTAAGPVKLVLKPKGKAKKLLRRRGKLKATVTLSFMPSDGAAKPAATKKKVTFKRKK